MPAVENHPIILFDGVCNLCNGFVQFVIRCDTRGIFHFASLQSEVGAEILRDHGLSTKQFSSMVLADGDQIWLKSDAALEIFRRLPAPYKWLGPLRLIPQGLRNTGYDFMARNRYRFFGKQESCMRPTPELRKRFL